LTDPNIQARYFLLGFEAIYGFPIDLVREIEPRWIWQVRTPHGHACLKVFRKRDQAYTSAQAGHYLHERGFRFTPGVIPTKDGDLVARPTGITDPPWWITLTEWIPGGTPYYLSKSGRDLAQAARILADFHVAIRGFRPWPGDLCVERWILSWERIHLLTELAEEAIKTEQRPEFCERLKEGLSRYRPLVDQRLERAVAARDLYAAAVEAEKSRGAQRHGDLNAGNFLIGEDCMMLIDLAQIEPGLRIVRDVGNLAWAFSASDAEIERAMVAYHQQAPLSPEEVELLPIVNDPVCNWGGLIDGYLSGDWTQQMFVAGYDGCVKGPERFAHGLAVAASALRRIVT